MLEEKRYALTLSLKTLQPTISNQKIKLKICTAACRLGQEWFTFYKAAANDDFEQCGVKYCKFAVKRFFPQSYGTFKPCDTSKAIAFIDVAYEKKIFLTK